MINTHTQSGAPVQGDRPWLMEGVAWGAVALSAGLAGLGVSGLVGWASPLAFAGSCALIVATLLTETAASRLPVHAEARFAEGGKLKGWLVVAGFAALTGWNVVAGHMGAVAIDRAGVADVRAPLEAAALQADTARETAEEALEAFDLQTQRAESSLEGALRGAFEAGYVTAGARAASSVTNDPQRAQRRADLVTAVSTARAADRVAEAALSAAPNGRPDYELWALALVLELLKGALVWFATGRERRTKAELYALPTKLDELTDEQVRARATLGASMMGSARQELIRRAKAA